MIDRIRLTHNQPRKNDSRRFTAEFRSRSANFRKHADKSDLLRAREINRVVIRVGRRDGNEIETSMVRTFVRNLVKRRLRRTIHFNVLPLFGPLSLPAHRVQLLFRGTSGSNIVRAAVSLPRSYLTALKHT